MNIASPLDLPVAVIGAGPVGLAAAAHLASRGLRPLVLEKGASVGAALLEWGHVRVFSPWRYNVDEAARGLLGRTGWCVPDPDWLPTGGEIVRDYLAPLAAVPEIASNLKLGATVKAAREVHLVLPETGVCNAAPSAGGGDGASGCCGGPVPEGVDACCVDDAVAKELGDAGCGCGERVSEPAAAAGCCRSAA